MRVLLFVCVLSGCFKPSYDHPACGPDRSCPSGFSCNTQDVCERPGGGGDDDAFVPKDGTPDDVTPDTPPTDAMFCLGTSGSMFRPCFATMPTTPLVIGSSALDTSTTSTGCDPIASSANVCVMVGSTISISAGARVTSTGSRALVLAAATTITVDGTLDLTGHLPVFGLGEASGNMLGTCDLGTRPTNGTGGGGAGASFMRTAANGGTAMGSQGIIGTAVAAVVTLRGGCPGQAGATGSGTLFAVGGHAGGAVYMIAGTSITIGSAVTAGGGGGAGGPDSGRAGGGGGGSGGLIGLDAPAVNVLGTGSLLANGGGGGEGSTGMPPAGDSGDDAVGKGAAAGGSGGNAPDGGDGSIGTVSPAPGESSLGNQGAGGGGGSIGLIRVIPLSALSTTAPAYISPAAQ